MLTGGLRSQTNVIDRATNTRMYCVGHGPEVSANGEALSETNWRRRMEGLLGVPATDGNSIEILRNGDEIFPAMLDAIRSATRSIDFLTFVYWQGPITEEFADALSERAQAGVRVRILLDALGCRNIPRKQKKQMRAAGCDLRWFRPIDSPLRFANHRTHRKVLICDETIAFTGGVGIAQEWAGAGDGPDSWRDTHFRIRGLAVDGLRGAFVDNWVETGPLEIDALFDHFPKHDVAGSSAVQVIAGASEAAGNDIASMLEILISSAKDHIHVTTAYFNPDDELAALLIGAANRGVQIEVLVPGQHADKRFIQIVGEARYEELLDEGISIRMYNRTMLHAKVLTVDGEVASVGSANINQRSFQYDEEVNLVIFDPIVVAELDADFANDLLHSKVVEPDWWAERSKIQRAAERAASVVADLI